ncbi:hypothetical protein BGZ95_011680, partial [Linnemannia exigua]
MTVQDTHPNLQAVRRVYENEQPASSTTPASIIYLVCHPDASSGKVILLWEDVLAAFKEDVIHVRSGAIVLPFLKGTGFKNLDPLRIAAVPGATLDVVVRNRLEDKELSLESLQVTLPGAHQLDDHDNADPAFNPPAIATARRNPVGGTVEAAWDNLTHIDNPDAGAARRGPQVIQDNHGASNDNNNEVNNEIDSNIDTAVREPKASRNSILLARAPQEPTSATAQDITEVIMNARLGDMHAQNALGERYKDGRGVHQDFEAAMDWYLKAAEHGLASAQFNVGDMYDY